MTYDHTGELHLLHNWLAAPGQLGNPRFLLDFLARYQAEGRRCGGTTEDGEVSPEEQALHVQQGAAIDEAIAGVLGDGEIGHPVRLAIKKALEDTQETAARLKKLLGSGDEVAPAADARGASVAK